MKLDEYVDLNTLDDLINNGYVSCKAHNEFPLRIYNYTKRAASLGFNRWPGTLERCRGLIVDHDDNIIAFGLRKFWNYVEGDDQGMSFSVYDKVDGSIGIVYQWEGQVYISTRGSFHSEMADWANQFLRENPEYAEFLAAPIVGSSPWYTPHVEIVYDDNRIVLDYDYEDLVLLGYNDEAEWTPAMSNWRYPGRMAEQFKFSSMRELAESEPRANAEGFVLQFEDGSMKKIKYGHYLELQRAIINMTERAIYNKIIVSRKELDDWILSLPNEFQAEAFEIRDTLLEKYADYGRQFIRYYNTVRKLDLSRKDLALKMQAENVPGWIRACVFSQTDENYKATSATIWKQIKP